MAYCLISYAVGQLHVLPFYCSHYGHKVERELHYTTMCGTGTEVDLVRVLSLDVRAHRLSLTHSTVR
jgi:hypothetical protein